jgi:hypothetical protein
MRCLTNDRIQLLAIVKDKSRELSISGLLNDPLGLCVIRKGT